MPVPCQAHNLPRQAHSLLLNHCLEDMDHDLPGIPQGFGSGGGGDTPVHGYLAHKKTPTPL